MEKDIKYLRDQYEYWFEVARRSTNREEQRLAIKRYKKAIESLIKIQKDTNIQYVPSRTSQ